MAVTEAREERGGELLTALRIAGVGLVAVALLPVETQHDGLCHPWRAARDAGPGAAVVLAAPGLAGILLIALSAIVPATPARAVGALGVLWALAAVASRGAEALAWDLLPAPTALAAWPAFGLLGVAFAVAAIRLAPVPRARPRALGALAAAVVLGAVHAARTSDLGAPLQVAERALAHLAAAGARASVVVGGALAALALWPAVAAAVAAGFVAARRAPPALAVIVAVAVPAAFGPVAQRVLDDPFGANGGWVGAAGAVITAGASLIAAMGAVGFLLAPRPPVVRGRALPVAAGVSVLGVAIAWAVMGRLARPRDPAVVPSLVEPTPAADQVFGATLPRWDSAALAEPPRPAEREVAAAELVDRARALGPGLSGALAALVAEGPRGGLVERRWYARVERVDAAAFALGLPYYVEPSAVVVMPGDPPRRGILVTPHRVAAARAFASEGRRVLALHLRAIGAAQGGSETLGRSRDVVPFALVALDEIDAYRADLDRLLAQRPLRCAGAGREGAADDEAREACGAALAKLAGEHDLGAALVATTERHEVQHRLDGPWLPRSPWLDARLALHPDVERRTVQRELRAYLAQATGPDPAPRLTLVRLLRLAILAPRGPDRLAASLAIDLLEDGGGAAEALPRLFALDDAALRWRAQVAWRTLAGEALPPVVLAPSERPGDAPSR